MISSASAKTAVNALAEVEPPADLGVYRVILSLFLFLGNPAEPEAPCTSLVDGGAGWPQPRCGSRKSMKVGSVAIMSR